MTPSELHSRILLHELRTILLDESREGTQLPQAYKDLIQSDPHNPSSYLITAEELEEHADPLAELCRIQVELIGGVSFPEGAQIISPYSSPIGTGNEVHIQLSPNAHPFQNDVGLAHLVAAMSGQVNRRHDLLARRWELTLPLYDEPYRDEWRQMRSSRLGRTTRMLTDILRYCALNQNQGKQPLIQGRDYAHAEQLRSQFRLLISELTDQELDPDYAPRATVVLLGNYVHFGTPHSQSVYPWKRPGENADITFTDHACHTVVPRIIRNESGGPPIPFITQATEDAAREIERNHRIRAIMAQDGRIQYNPKVAIRPESVIPDEPTETHLP